MRHTTSKPASKIKHIKDHRVSCRVPMVLWQRIEKVSARLGIDSSDVVRMGLMKGLPEYETKTN